MWQGVLSVLFPKRCIGCEIIIPHIQDYLCEVCRSKLPFTGITLNDDNTIHEKINLSIPIEYASSLLIFKKHNITQRLIHHLKYKNKPELGEWLAEIWYEQNKENPVLKEIEIVAPVPLHPKRLKKRNYNQVGLCAQKLARLLECEYDENALSRIHHLESQIDSGKYQRLERMKGAFKRTHQKSGHYLLVDDVFTTGATLTSCARELLKIQNTKVSIFTIAAA